MQRKVKFPVYDKTAKKYMSCEFILQDSVNGLIDLRMLKIAKMIGAEYDRKRTGNN